MKAGYANNQERTRSRTTAEKLLSEKRHCTEIFLLSTEIDELRGCYDLASSVLL